MLWTSLKHDQPSFWFRGFVEAVLVRVTGRASTAKLKEEIASIIIHCCHITYRPNRPNYRPVLLCKMPLKSHASAGPSSDKWRISDFIKLSLPRLRCEEGPVTSSDDQNGQHCKEYLTVGAKPPKNGTLQSNSKYSGNLRQQTPAK